jgi:Asp-tRNA(Asn)/Glu-tRNA(Gln) amidotransferase A subunit family amidase
MTMPGDLLSRPLIEIARELRERRASARELVEAAIARHESFGERLHAYSFWAPAQARGAADAADAAFAAGVSNRRIVRNTAWVNYLGLCAITMPVGRDRAGMPVGLQLSAPAHAEERLLTIALAAERVLGTGAEKLGTPPLLAS